jgi:hypothetical protein
VTCPRQGQPWPGGTLGRIVFSLSRTDTFLGARYRRLARRRGKQKAIVASSNSVLIAVWHLLADPEAVFCDLGPTHYESRINKDRRVREGDHGSEAIPRNGTPPQSLAKQYIRYESPPLCRSW